MFQKQDCLPVHLKHTSFFWECIQLYYHTVCHDPINQIFIQARGGRYSRSMKRKRGEVWDEG